jgi:peptidoglycan hydrolase-like protein with peptidoglycan-binding domain
MPKMSSSSMGGAVVLGVIGTAIGVVAIDYAFSDPGESWIDQLFGKKVEAHAERPSALSQAGRRLRMRRARGGARPAPRLQPRMQYPQQYAQHPQYQAQPQYQMQQTQQPLAPPVTITPAMVSDAARKINAAFGTNLQTDGILTADLQHLLLQVQKELGLPATGYPDEATLMRLGTQLGAAAKPAAKVVTDFKNLVSKSFGGPPSSTATGPDEGLRAAQRALNDALFFGQKVLVEDGIMGAKTSDALKDFQRSNALPVTGILDKATHDKLIESGKGFFGAIQDSGKSAFGSPSHKTGVYGEWGGDAW